jgi:hypothetical protein
VNVSEPPIGTEAPLDLRIRLGRFAMDPHQIIYGTIMLMVAYALYDEGTDPLGRGPLLELIAVSFAPLIALAMAHGFSEALDFQIRHSRRLRQSDRWRLTRENAKYLLIAIPPIILMTILTMLGWDANVIIEVLQVLGLLSLSFWGVYAARKAGLGRGRQFTFALGYGFMGALVIAIELLITH